MEVDVNTLVALVTAKPLVLRISTEDGAQELGQIVRSDDLKLRISPVAGSPLQGINPGPYADRGAAMAAISARLQGTCLHARPNAAGAAADPDAQDRTT
jgi:hypothetical protein